MVIKKRVTRGTQEGDKGDTSTDGPFDDIKEVLTYHM